MAEDDFREALGKLCDDFVETVADAEKAIQALEDRADFLNRWIQDRAQS
jgi:hypothetical protein